MTLADAQAAIAAGSPFGAVFPLLQEADHAALREWFVRTPDVRPRKPKAGPSPTDLRAAREQGFTGDPCPVCQGVHLKRNGSCLLCIDCGSTTGCS